VPYLIPLAWFMMIYPSYVIANLVLEGHATGTRAGVWRLVRLAAVSAAVMTAWDLVVDPILSGPSARAWIWENGGPYFGIPIQNFLGWLLTTFTVYLAYRAVEQRMGAGATRGVALAPPRPVVSPLGSGVAALPVAAYGLMLVSDLLSGVEPAGVAIVGPLVMGAAGAAGGVAAVAARPPAGRGAERPRPVNGHLAPRLCPAPYPPPSRAGPGGDPPPPGR